MLYVETRNTLDSANSCTLFWGGEKDLKKMLALLISILALASISVLMVARAYPPTWPPDDWTAKFDPGNPVDRNGNGWIWEKSWMVGDKKMILQIDDPRHGPWFPT